MKRMNFKNLCSCHLSFGPLSYANDASTVEKQTNITKLLYWTE